MFRYESEMIPVLVDSLSKVFNTGHITTEFATGNGVADLVLTTEINRENLFFNDYGLTALFVKLFYENKKMPIKTLNEMKLDNSRVKKLLQYLQNDGFIAIENDIIVRTRKYKAHTQNLISIEVKLKDWKSGLYQALRYKFYSNKSYLAFPEQYIHRVDLELLKENNVGLISVMRQGIKIVCKPRAEKPQDIVSYFFLSELFVRQLKTFHKA